MECSSETTDEEVERRLTEVVGGWLEKINARGFPVDVLRGFVENNDEQENVTEEAEDDDTWYQFYQSFTSSFYKQRSQMSKKGSQVSFCTFGTYTCKNFALNVDEIDPRWEEGVVRVFDPYVDFALDEIETVEGKKNAEGKPVGQCNVILKNGDSVFGSFRQGIRQGRGAIEGTNCFKYGLVGLRGYYKDGILTGEGRAILAPGAWARVGRLTLEGVFSNGYLEGPVRGIDDRGNLVSISSTFYGQLLGT